MVFHWNFPGAVIISDSIPTVFMWPSNEVAAAGVSVGGGGLGGGQNHFYFTRRFHASAAVNERRL